MVQVVASRAAQSALLLLLISVAVFALVRLTPGDPGVLLYGMQASPGDLAQLRQRWGLDDPIHLQYAKWLINALSGDLGRSYIDGSPVGQIIFSRVPATLLLTVSALTVAFTVGTIIGTLGAIYRRSWVDHATTALATLCYSSPAFWVGILLIFVFSIGLGWLPSGGMRPPGADLSAAELLRHMVLPASVLALRETGRTARVVRASVLDIVDRDFVRAAVAKGLSRRVVARRHVLRNALLPLISLVGLSVPGLLSGAVVVETVFGWPGMGRLIVESALQRDYPVMVAEVLVVAVFALAGSLLADVACAIADPRLRRREGEVLNG